MSLKRYTLNSRVLEDLKKRSSIGIVFYIILSYTLIFQGDYFLRNTLSSMMFLGAVNGICIIRFIHVLLYKKLAESNPVANTVIFITTVIITAAIWGVGFAYFMIMKEEFTAKLLMAVCTAGLTAGGVVAFIPERRLAIIFDMLMMLPSVVVMMILGVQYNLALMVVLFCIYLVLLAIRGNKEYWDALENEAKLKDKTIELKRLSHTDALTGIYNRRYFNEIFDFEWKRSSRDKTILTLIMCDIDHFKSVNDSFGHIAGDEYLVHIAGILKNTFKRDTDIVARYGGEEFIVLLSGVESHYAYLMAEELRKKIGSYVVTFDGKDIMTTMSFGISSTLPDNLSTTSRLITRADHALYRAKNKGRNRVEVDQFDP